MHVLLRPTQPVNIMAHTVTVPIFSEHLQKSGELSYDEFESGDCEVVLIFEGQRFAGQAEDYFDALIAVRKPLEEQGYLIGVYGASRNVWPSPMSRSMGGGIKAYKMELGRQALSQDLVNIFDSGADLIPATIAEQEQYKEDWFSSLRSR